MKKEESANSRKLDVVESRLAMIAPYLICFVVVFFSALALMNY
jgi:hypothetical protein